MPKTETRPKTSHERQGDVAAAWVAGIIAAVCASVFAPALLGAARNPNTNPQVGWVQVESGTSKRCDGTTLRYRGDSTGVVADSPECAS